MKTKYKTRRGFTRTPKSLESGFTVLESIVAIGVLSAAIAGAFTAIQTNLSQSIIVKDEVKAFYLAQEAVEIIRNARDHNQLERITDPASTVTWLTGISEDVSDHCYFGKVCRMEVSSPSPDNFETCDASEWGYCPVLRKNASSFIYGYNYGLDWSDTNFVREVKIERVRDDPTTGDPVEIAVTVRVSWKKGLIDRQFEAKTYLFNWI